MCSVRHSDGDRVGVSGGRGRRLRRNSAVDCIALRSAVAGRRNSIRADDVAPNGAPAAIGVERIIDRGSATGHFAGRDSRAGAGAGVEADVVRRRVGALHLEGGRLVDVAGENALAAEIEGRGADDRARCRNGHLHRESRRSRGCIRSAHEY